MMRPYSPFHLGLGLGGPATVPLVQWSASSLALPASATFTRAGTAYAIDHEGIYNQAATNGVRFAGARRVQNIATALTTQTLTVVSGRQYQVTIKGDNGATCECSNAFTGTLTADGTHRISWGSGTPKSSTSTSLVLTVTGTLTELQVEDVTARTVKIPSEYVAFDAGHGAGVNGVKYFGYANGSTVSVGGVVTEAVGATIDASTIYAELEPAATNSMAQSLGSGFTATPASGTGTMTPAAGILGPNTAGLFADTDATIATYFRATPASFNNDATIVMWLKQDLTATAYRASLTTVGVTGTNTAVAACVDLSTGAVSLASVYAGVTATIASVVENGIIKVAMKRSTPPALGNTLLRCDLYPSRYNASCAAAVALTGQATLLYTAVFWGDVSLAAALASSPIITSGSALTRAADVLNFSGVTGYQADNESRLWHLGAANVDADDWDGIVDASPDTYGRMRHVKIYAPGARP